MNHETRTENEIHIDTSLIPDHVRDLLAEDSMLLVLRIMRRPGGKKLLETKKAEIARRKAYSAKIQKEV